MTVNHLVFSSIVRRVLWKHEMISDDFQMSRIDGKSSTNGQKNDFNDEVYLRFRCFPNKRCSNHYLYEEFGLNCIPQYDVIYSFNGIQSRKID